MSRRICFPDFTAFGFSVAHLIKCQIIFLKALNLTAKCKQQQKKNQKYN